MAEEYKYISELLQTGIGTEGSLLIPKKIHDTLIAEVDKALLPRSEAALLLGPAQIPGSSIDIDLEVENKMDVREVGEGAGIFLDNGEYTSFNLKPVKYGVAIRITREMMEDAKWNLLQNSIRTAGKRFAENENSLVISDALDNATNTVAGGAAVTIANITRAIQYLEDADFTPSTLLVGAEVANDLRQIDTFAEADKFGTREMMERGFVGRIYGMNVLRASTSAGMTTTTAYVYDRDEAYVIAEKRPITIEKFELPTFDMTGTVLTQRLKIRQIKADAIAKITSS